MKTNALKTIIQYAQITLGAALFAAAVKFFFDPNGLVTGGVSGIAIILRSEGKRWFGAEIPLWVTTIALNAPLFVIGAKALGPRFVGRTIYAVAADTAILFAMSLIPTAAIEDKLLAAVFGGAVSGVGLGLVFRCAATTGGSDLAASVLNRYIRHIPMTTFMFVIDAAVVACGFFVFGAQNAMYAVVAIFIGAKISGAMLEGLGFARAAFIISDRYAEIAEALETRLERGVTGLSGVGMYTGADKRVLFCVVSVKQVARLKEIVTEIDPTAFAIVADAREVRGEGFSGN
ncbi:MAG: YitT family protein [Clostridiales bacterium]|jgi:uncharacterized membrane-anchored protein YitT (DUF2179 family)|nr:YitT family protein [Clostridiales bacterium]